MCDSAPQAIPRRRAVPISGLSLMAVVYWHCIARPKRSSSFRPARGKACHRSLREVAPGRYETTISAPAGGAWELVVTTGLAALSACFRIDVEGPEAAEKTRTLTIRAAPVRLNGDRTAELVLAIDFDQSSARLHDRLPFVVMALERPWRAPIVAVREPGSNRYVARLTLPGPGQYPVMPGFVLPGGDRIVPGLVRVEE